MGTSRITLPSLEVVLKDAFVMLSLYRFVHKWFAENEYESRGGDPNMEEDFEILYLAKEGTHMNPHESEVRLWWRTKKRGVPFANSGSKFYDYHIDIDWWAFGMVTKEIMRDGKREKVQHAELRILIKPYMNVTDIRDTPILKYFDQWFKSRLIKKNLEENRKMLYQDAYKLQSAIKRYLELNSFMPKEDVFHEKFDFI